MGDFIVASVVNPPPPLLQVKIMKNPDLLHTASEQFLGKKEHEIKSTVLQTLEGHLRAILGKTSGPYSVRP